MVVLGIGGFFAFRPSDLALPSDTAAPPKPAWIEVVATPVTEYAADGATVLRELASGDALTHGSVIASESGAKARIHFPDGSVARLDEESRISLDEEMLDPKDNTLRVRLHLFTGRIWSKVVSLATPASLWEVKTSNTVVAVRGTAFGVEFKDGRSRVISAEHAVTVAVVDPATGSTITGTEVIVDEKHMITIDNKEIADIKKHPEKTKERIEMTPKDVRREKWIEEAAEEDKKFDAEQASRDEVPVDGTQLEQTPAKETTNDQSPQTNTGAAPRKNEETAKPESISGTRDTNTDTQKDTIPATQLTIEVTGGMRTFAEGERVAMRAFLGGTGGARVDATKQVSWQVVGPIGAISADGVFHAGLLPPITEVGEGVGAIVATWKDPRTGQTLTARTPIIRVELVPQEGPAEG